MGSGGVGWGGVVLQKIAVRSKRPLYLSTAEHCVPFAVMRICLSGRAPLWTCEAWPASATKLRLCWSGAITQPSDADESRRQYPAPLGRKSHEAQRTGLPKAHGLQEEGVGRRGGVGVVRGGILSRQNTEGRLTRWNRPIVQTLTRESLGPRHGL